jgi:alpha-tubulin suppressor-like RCC1 family protein/subtilase family serine protease
MSACGVRVVVTVLLVLSAPLTLFACGEGDPGAAPYAQALGGVGPDLVTIDVSDPPAQAVIGDSFTASDVTRNDGNLAATASMTRYYLSPDKSKGTTSRPLSPLRAVAALGAGAQSAGSVVVTIPANVPEGVYYLLACADNTFLVSEQGESNNCLGSANPVIVTGPDLVVTAATEPPATLLLGQTILATDTVVNVGSVAAGATETKYLLSLDTVRDGTDKTLNPQRAVPGLTPGGSSTGSLAVTVPSNVPAGTYYLLACADSGARVNEANETNNCLASAGTTSVTGADLVVTQVTVPDLLAVGASYSFVDSTLNRGTGPSIASTTQYYVSPTPVKIAGYRLLTGNHDVGVLAAGETDTGSVTVTVPSGVAAGSYYVLACADNLFKVAEENEVNNCVATASTITVGGADLVVTFTSDPPLQGGIGTTFPITDEVANVGTVAAGASVTRYWLSRDTLRNTGDELLTGDRERAVPALAPQETNRGTINSLKVPASVTPGFYYVLACADEGIRVAETNDGNNCTASTHTIGIGLPDLVVEGLAATAAFPGDTTTVSESTRNVGFAPALASSTRFYLSTDGTRSDDDPLLGSRAVESLAAGAASSGSSPFTIAFSVAPGSYFVIACADQDGVVTEGDEANCAAAPLQVRDRCEGVVCAAADACHVAGVCSSATGTCSNPVAPEGTVCSDGSVCTTVDTCHAGACVAGAALTCDDGNTCTDDSCNPAAGCVFASAANGTSCEDGDACTVADVCTGGHCTGGAPLSCNDGNLCTRDSCDPTSGCVATNAPDGTGCTDDNACTDGDSCQAGACVAGTPLTCDDHNRCTDDSCSASSGCVFAAVADGTTCTDGSVCTDGDTCQAGACTPGAPITCDDHNGCTGDHCDADSGCVFAAVTDGTSCADGNVCNGAETCQGGSCSAGAPDNGGCDPIATCTSTGDGRTCACPEGTIDSHGDGTLCEPTVDCGTPVQVATGAYHSCALLSGGTVRCWGLDHRGQVGDGVFTNIGRVTPVPVLGLEHVTELSAAQFHTCALLTDGTVRCWGDNASGQLGDGTTDPKATPVAVAGLAGVSHISAGDNHVCAVLADGTARCWGDNSSLQLGVWGGGFSVTPIEVPNLVGAVQIAAAEDHTCAVLLDGTARCWGKNGFGQLGNGGGGNSADPVEVVGLGGVVQLAAAASHTCARLGDGTVRCWGRNLDGQLGDGTGDDRSTPVATVGITGATWVAAGQHHSCATLGDGSMRCWGGSWEGQLGYGGLAGSALPLVVSDIAAATRAAGGWFHTCAIDGGSVRCWGMNQYGGLGDGTTTRSLVPSVPVSLTCE